MGGKAIKNSIRFEGYKYEMIYSQIYNKLRDAGFKNRLSLTKCYREKESHGDMDIIVCDEGNRNIAPEIIDVFFENSRFARSGNVHINGPCTSIRYEGHQVDFIITSPEDYDMTVAYYAWNDLSLLIGKIAQYAGFKYGSNGLRIKKVDSDGHVLVNHTITKDPMKALDFLGYDTERFIEGFDTLDDIYEYALSTPLACVNALLPESSNGRQRKRDSSRVNYNIFLDKLKNTDEFYDLIESYPRLEWEDRLSAIGDYFGFDKVDEIKSILKQKIVDAKMSKEIKEKFNGKIVMDELGLTGKDLGIFMSDFNSKFDTLADKHKYVMNNDLDTLLKN